jgi:hypothetical protein
MFGIVVAKTIETELLGFEEYVHVQITTVERPWVHQKSAQKASLGVGLSQHFPGLRAFFSGLSKCVRRAKGRNY